MICITLDLKPLSYNAFYKNTKGGRRYLPEASKLYLEELQYLLGIHSKELVGLVSKLGKEDMVYLEIDYEYKDFYKKDGTFHKRCMDVDNPNKIIIDELFKVMDVDDYLLGNLDCTKRPGKEDKVTLSLGIVTISRPTCFQN